jgi:hypothetical protein
MTVLAANSLYSLAVSGYPTSDVNGTSHTVTVTAKDSSGAVISGYTGTVALTSSDSYDVISPASHQFSVGDGGSYSFTVTLNYGGTQSITATDATAGVSGSQSGILVSDLIWVVNSNGTLTKLNSAGGGASSTSSGTPSAGIAFDHSGDAWSLGSTSLDEFTNTGSAVGSYSGGGLSSPTALAIDGNGSVWVANGNGSLSHFSNGGTVISPSNGFVDSSLSTPTGIVLDGAGNVWISNGGNASITEFIGGAAPVITPTVSASSSNSLGVKP